MIGTSIWPCVDASPLLAADPRRAKAVGRVRLPGVEIFHSKPDDRGEGDLFIRATIDGIEVSWANFRDDQFLPYCLNVRTDEGYRRLGFAKAIYVLAELLLGKPLDNHWKDSPHQTPEARLFWADPDRPFGYPFPDATT